MVDRDWAATRRPPILQSVCFLASDHSGFISGVLSWWKASSAHSQRYRRELRDGKRVHGKIRHRAGCAPGRGSTIHDRRR